VPEVTSSNDSLRIAYDLACEAYARKFLHELDYKPFDRELLQEFAALVSPPRPGLDLGCGPGHTTAHLTSLGLAVTGIDFSPRMIETATTTFPQSRFEVGDFCALRFDSSSIAGILGFYCTVHLTADELLRGLAEMFRVLRGGGVLLLSFHVGSEVVHVENFLETSATLDFTFFEPADVEAALRTVGFTSIDVRVREPYNSEHPSRRCYILAHKPQNPA
jgi:SAM-dependent methyltransferase